jgi:hypothetical protein
VKERHVRGVVGIDFVLDGRVSKVARVKELELKKKQLTENPLFLDPAKHQPVSAPGVRAQSMGQRVEVGAKVYRIEGLS